MNYINKHKLTIKKQHSTRIKLVKNKIFDA